jgi:hypothetical protein
MHSRTSVRSVARSGSVAVLVTLLALLPAHPAQAERAAASEACSFESGVTTCESTTVTAASATYTHARGFVGEDSLAAAVCLFLFPTSGATGYELFNVEVTGTREVTSRQRHRGAPGSNGPLISEDETVTYSVNGYEFVDTDETGAPLPTSSINCGLAENFNPPIT